MELPDDPPELPPVATSTITDSPFCMEIIEMH